jgi:glycosyltransferase involved in cell wall biosynthesis
VPYQVDHHFWKRPPTTDMDDDPMICSAGLEYRDYPTLVAAVSGLPVRVVIAAASHWSRHHHSTGGSAPPANVSVTSLDYVGLRDLYARSRFVVVPLREVENQAGITVILEAMAMGKAVIVSATGGQRDVVRGRIWSGGGVSPDMIGGPAVFDVPPDLAEAETGLYVPPGDDGALRRAIEYLLGHPEEAARMGAAGRRVVAECMNLDLFVRRIVAIVQTPKQTALRRTREQGRVTAATMRA